jgi:hypothetical protein
MRSMAGLLPTAAAAGEGGADEGGAVQNVMPRVPGLSNAVRMRAASGVNIR